MSIVIEIHRVVVNNEICWRVQRVWDSVCKYEATVLWFLSLQVMIDC